VSPISVLILFISVMFEGRPRQNSSYRSVRYSTIRKDSRTADPD